MFKFLIKTAIIAIISGSMFNCGSYLVKKPTSFGNNKINVKIHYAERNIREVMSGGPGDYRAVDGSDFVKFFITMENVSLFPVSIKYKDISIGDEKTRIHPALIFPFKSKDKLESIELGIKQSATLLVYFEFPKDKHPGYYFHEDVGNFKLQEP